MTETQQIVILIQRPVFHVPAKVLNHGIFFHFGNCLRIIIKRIQNFLQSFGISVDIVLQPLGCQIIAVNPPPFGKENLGTETVDAVVNRIDQPAR